MRIALIYPPPWKIPAPQDAPISLQEGGPEPGSEGTLDGDFRMLPFGLLSLAVQAMEAGHEISVYNLSVFPWADVVDILHRTKADVYGLSCFTVNRRGVDLISRAIKQMDPSAHITVGGPHATALAEPMLEHYPALDSVVIGEGEATFLELLQRLNSGHSPAGVAGLAYRDAQHRIVTGPRRDRISNLDSLRSPLDYFASPILVTSRGCPGQCTFCASHVVWGRAVHWHSAAYVIREVEQAVIRHGFRRLAIKDDTFTADRDRALAICRGIQERGLNFLWSCDTRVDCLDEELLTEMRRAGCQRLSLGVESADGEILRQIGKAITVEQILGATHMAQQLGFEIRYYMMVGNRGETLETLQHSLDFLVQARPNEFTFSLLGGYPGSPEMERLVCEGRTTADVYFKKPSATLPLYLGLLADKDAILSWFTTHQGYLHFSDYDAAHCRQILGRFPDLHLAYLDLGAACLREGYQDEAEQCFLEALRRGYPIPGEVFNYLACHALMANRLGQAAHFLAKAAETSHSPEIRHNREQLDAWLARPSVADGESHNHTLHLLASHDFELEVPQTQPILPGPIDGIGGHGLSENMREMGRQLAGQDQEQQSPRL